MSNYKSKKEFQLLDLKDPINKLHYAMAEKKINDKNVYYFSEIEDYLEYVKAITEKDKIVTIKGNSVRTLTNQSKSPEFFKNYRALVREAATRTVLVESQLIDLINRIKSHTDNGFELTEDQYSFLFGGSSKQLSDFIESLNLPIIKKVNDHDPIFKDMVTKMNSDSYFRNGYKVVAMYQPDIKETKFPKKDGWHKTTGLHGTKNASLLQIMESGFKTASQLRKENNKNFSYAGSALGDGIYFARPDQASKPLWYMDHDNQSMYIIIADLFYKTKREVTSFSSSYKYDGTNMTHAKAVGAYGRDELVVLPNQINIKYILEIRKNK